jgi:hypothetical protein
MTVSVGDGVSLTLVQPSVYRGTSAPTANVKVGDLWMDTSTNPPVLKQCENLSPVTWVSVDSGGGGGGDGFNLLVVNGGAATLSTTLTLSNSNNVSFGLAGGVITATATFAGGGGGGIAIAAGTQTATTNTVAFVNSNGISFGMSNSSQITASHNGLTSQSNQAFSAPGGSSAFQTLNFVNSNGVSFTNTNGSLAATVRTDYAASDHSHGNPTLALTNLSGTTASNSNGLTLSLSAAAGGGGADGYNILSAGTQLANTNTTVAFADSNGISFGMSGSSRITASYTVPDVANFISRVNISAGTTSNNLTNFVLSNSNGISFGLNGSTITATYTVPTQSVQTQNMVSVQGSTGNISFSNSNGITFGFNASTITASHNGLTTARASNDAIGLNSAFTAGPLAMTINSSGLSLNAGSAAGTSSGFAGNLISGSMTHNTAGLNLSLNHPAWLTTAALSNHSHGNPTLNLTNLSGTTASNSAGFTLSLSAGAGGGVTPVASASNGSFSFTTLNFSNANNVTFGTSAGSIITASVAAPGAAAENNWYNLLGNTSGNTTASGSTIGFSGIGITLSGTNNSNIVISAPPVSSLVGVGGISLSTNGSTISISNTIQPGTATLWQPFNEGLNVAGQVGNASIHIVPLPTPAPAALGELDVDRLCIPLIVTNATNSTGTVTISHSFGLYTRGTGTQNTRLSLAHSTSATLAVTFSGTVNNSTYAGIRLLTIPWTTTINDGRYYVAQWSRTTTGGANASVSQLLVSQLNSNFSGLFGVNSNRSNQWPLGYGVFSASVTTAMPASIAFSQIDGTASLAARAPSFFMISGTA